MKTKIMLEKVKVIGELIKQIRQNNNLINQDLDRHAQLVEELKRLVADEEVQSYTDGIEEILVLIDINKGFTIMGNYQNPYMNALVEPTNEEALKIHQLDNQMILVVNESHHEGSREFTTLNPDNPLPHCIEGTEEVKYAEDLQWILDEYPVFEKNTTMAAHAPGYLDMFYIFPNLKRVRFAGGVTDICYFEAVLSTIKFFDQNDIHCEVVAEQELYDTYDAPWHSRDEWTEMTNKFMTQAGVKLIKRNMRGR